jgi:hypothetical protein
MKHFLSFLVGILFCNLGQASVWYVNLNASGSNDGTSWTNAYVDLQSAFSSATSGDSIWVAKGTYKPTSGTTRTIYFRLKSGISIFGAFSGNESSVDARNVNSNLTILSGDIGNPGSASDNTYHVVYGSNINSTVIIDGFRITGGNIGSGSEGAGMYLDNCKTIVRNCHITDNSSGYGGGIYQYNGSLVVMNCRINENVANSHTGAAMYCTGSGGTTMVYNTQFRNNVVDPSAATGILYVYGDLDLLVDRCEFSGNHAKEYGIITTSSDKTTKIINTSIIGNYCREAKFISNNGSLSSDFSVINCTISGNHADSNVTKQGNYPAIFTSNTLKTRMVLNSIIYNNTSSADFSNGLTVSNCIMSRPYSNATNSFIVNPQFINPGNRLNAPFVISGLNYELHIKSKAIDLGDDTFLSTNDSLDLTGNKRILGYNPDMGAWEKQYCTLASSISADGLSSICPGESLNFYADSGNYWIWNNGATTRTLNVNSAGKYNVISVDTLKGCRGVSEDSVIVYASHVEINGKLRFCEGDSSILTTAGNGITFEWNTLDTGKSIQVYTGGKYLVQSTTDMGCISKDSVTIIVDTLPIPKISISETSGKLNNDAILCKGTSITLLASGGISYQWSDSSNKAQLLMTPATDTESAVKVTNIRGCVKWSEPMKIKVNALPVPGIIYFDSSGLMFSDGTICNGDSILLTSNLQSKYSWNTGSKERILRLKPASTTTYVLTVTDSNACQATTSAKVTVNPLPQPVITKVNNQFQTGSFSSFRWFLNDTLIPTATNGSYTPSRNGKYTVEVFNAFGCKKLSAPYYFKTGQENISRVKFSFFPNPGHDRLHFETEHMSQYTLSIYNSVGIMVYSGKIENTQDLDISEWPKGVYSIQVLSVHKYLIESFKLVKI